MAKPTYQDTISQRSNIQKEEEEADLTFPSNGKIKIIQWNSIWSCSRKRCQVILQQEVTTMKGSRGSQPWFQWVQQRLRTWGRTQGPLSVVFVSSARPEGRQQIILLFCLRMFSLWISILINHLKMQKIQIRLVQLESSDLAFHSCYMSQRCNSEK